MNRTDSLRDVSDNEDSSADTQKISGVQQFIGRFRLQTVLIISLVIVVVLAMGITGFLSFFNGQLAVNDMANQVQNQVSDRIFFHLYTYLDVPHHINRLCSDCIHRGEISVRNNSALQNHFQGMISRYRHAEAICYGNEAEGNYTIISKVGAPGIANGTDLYLGYSRKETNFSFEEYLISHDGQKIKQTVSLEHYDPRTRPWYKSATEARGPVWTPIYMWLEGVVGIDAVLPVYSQNGELLGVLDTALTLTGIGDFLQDLDITENGQAFIIDEEGYLVASSIIKEPYIRKNDELVRFSAREMNNAVIRSAAEYISTHNLTGNQPIDRWQFTLDIPEEGGRQLVQVTPFQDRYGLEWLIVVVVPESDFMEGINNNNKTTGILIISSIIFTIIICILLARWVTKPLASMNESAKAFANGDWSAWKELNRRDELGQLSHSFKQMADQLKSSFSSLKNSEERYMGLFHSSADAILVFKSHNLDKINHAGEKMFDVTEAEATGKEARTLFGNIGTAIADMIDESTSTQNGGYLDNTVSVVRDGKERFMNIRLTRFFEKDSVMSLVHIRDITDQRLAIIAHAEQEALRESYVKIQMILQHLPDSTFVVGKKGDILFWNQAFENLTGITAKDIIGKGYDDYSVAIFNEKRPLLANLLLDDSLSANGLYDDITRSGDTIKTSYWINFSGEMKYISVMASLLYDSNGEVIGAIESLRDITSHKQAEEALLIANKKLNLLSSITRHDIINKIMVSKGFMALLKDTKLDSDQISLIDGVLRSMEDIDHFVAFTRMYQEIGMKVPVWQNVRDVCDHAIAGVNAGPVQINNSISDISILVDPLFEKVCYNLVENAIRHGEGLTRIDIRAYEIDNGLRISIEDNGVGVPDDQKELIFERGFGKNTGYGLFLVREILSISGISIAEHGQYGTGSRFDIDVPPGRYRKNESYQQSIKNNL